MPAVARRTRAKRLPTASRAAMTPADREHRADSGPSRPAQQRGAADADDAGDDGSQRACASVLRPPRSPTVDDEEGRSAAGEPGRRARSRASVSAMPDHRAGDGDHARRPPRSRRTRRTATAGCEESAHAHRERARGEEDRRRRLEARRLGERHHDALRSRRGASPTMTSQVRTSLGSAIDARRHGHDEAGEPGDPLGARPRPVPRGRAATSRERRRRAGRRRAAG